MTMEELDRKLDAGEITNEQYIPMHKAIAGVEATQRAAQLQGVSDVFLYGINNAKVPVAPHLRAQFIANVKEEILKVSDGDTRMQQYLETEAMKIINGADPFKDSEEGVRVKMMIDNKLNSGQFANKGDNYSQQAARGLQYYNVAREMLNNGKGIVEIEARIDEYNKLWLEGRVASVFGNRGAKDITKRDLIFDSNTMRKWGREKRVAKLKAAGGIDVADVAKTTTLDDGEVIWEFKDGSRIYVSDYIY